LNEVVPGIFHWTAVHPDIGARVSSYYVGPAGIVIDPLEPEDGMGFFDALDVPPQQVVLTTGLHWRHSDRFRERFGATVRVARAGMDRWGAASEREAEPFEFGDELAPGVVAREIGGIAPDDTALHITHGGGAIAFADALLAHGGELTFMPDHLLGDPAKDKAAITDSLRGLLTRDFDALLFAHSDPIATDGHSRLTDFVNREGA
jgi:hypothetical protein